jgi:hypothetical protein
VQLVDGHLTRLGSVDLGLARVSLAFAFCSRHPGLRDSVERHGLAWTGGCRRATALQARGLEERPTWAPSQRALGASDAGTCCGLNRPGREASSTLVFCTLSQHRRLRVPAAVVVEGPSQPASLTPCSGDWPWSRAPIAQAKRPSTQHSRARLSSLYPELISAPSLRYC